MLFLLVVHRFFWPRVCSEAHGLYVFDGFRAPIHSVFQGFSQFFTPSAHGVSPLGLLLQETSSRGASAKPGK